MAEVGPAGQLRTPERVQVGVGQPRDQRLPARVQDFGAGVTVRAHLRLTANRDDRSVTHRDRRRERADRVERPDPGTDDRQVSGHPASRARDTRVR